MCIRVSRGHFDPERAAEFESVLQSSAPDILRGVRVLPGLVSYTVSLNPKEGTILSMSEWDNEDHARAMSSVPVIILAGAELRRRGATFDPVEYLEVVWKTA